MIRARGVFAASALALLPGVFWGLPFGKFVVGANVILDGGVPYRDFWTVYAPGSFYLVAGLFALFGRQIVVQGLACVLLRAASATVFFHLLRRTGTPGKAAVLLSAVFTGMLWTTAPELDTYAPALLLVLLAVGRLLRHFETGRRLHAVQAGLLFGVAAWFKHDVAAYAAAAAVAARLLVGAGAGAFSERRAHAAWLAAAAVLPLLPVAALIARAAGPEAVNGLFVFPATVFPKVFGERYPPLVPDPVHPVTAWLRAPGDPRLARRMLVDGSTWITAWAPAAAFLAGGITVLRRRRTLDAQTLAAAVLFLCLLPFFWQAAHVQRNTHVFSMATFSLLLAGMALRRTAGTPRAALVAALAVYAAGLWTSPAMSLARAASRLPGSRTLAAESVAAVRVSREEWSAYQPVVDRVRGLVADGEPIYVGLARHDAPVVTNMRFYYLTGHPGCIRYLELHPGVADAVDVQREIVRAIRDRGVRCAVLWHFGWPDETLDRIKVRRRLVLPELGATILDEFLADSFEPVARYGEYEVRSRKTTDP
jgi:hypothetical protein